MLTVTASPACTIDSSCHAVVRTNPCAGAPGVSVLSANQGKQMGTPPRMGRPSSQRDLELTKRTSSGPRPLSPASPPVEEGRVRGPRGCHEVTCAPCRYISAAASRVVMATLTSPPFPSTTLAMPGIPNRRSNSAMAARSMRIPRLGTPTTFPYSPVVPWRPRPICPARSRTFSGAP